LLTSQFKSTYSFMGGYPTVTDLLQGLMVLQPPGTYFNPPYSITLTGYWEFDLYIGLIGLGFLLFFGVYQWIKHRGGEIRYFELVIPMLALLVLSLGSVFKVFHDSPIPILQGERVSARMIIVPFIFLLVIATIEFQRWLDTHRMNFAAQGGLLIILGGEMHDLWEHFNLWSISKVASSFTPNSVAFTMWFVHNHADYLYLRSLVIGLAGSVLAALALIFFIIWEKQDAKTKRSKAFEIYDPDTWSENGEEFNDYEDTPVKTKEGK
jgi:hypothetical protein